MLAVSRLTDAAELEGVALRGDHPDAAVAAVDALSEPSAETLSGISQKARTKAAQKRARLLAKAFEDPAPVEATPAVTYPEAEQERARALVAQMTALAAAGDLAAVREGYGAGRVTWVELLADADIQPDLVETFETASSAVRDRIAADEPRPHGSRPAASGTSSRAGRARGCVRARRGHPG